MEHMFDRATCSLSKPVLTQRRVPCFSSPVPAGFPSPADDHLDGHIDLIKLLIENESATFLTRASGDSMEGAGIYDGDLLIVNRALEVVDGCLVVAVIQGEFTLKRYRLINKNPWLYPENPRYVPMRITSEMEFTVWGVIKHTIRFHR